MIPWADTPNDDLPNGDVPNGVIPDGRAVVLVPIKAFGAAKRDRLPAECLACDVRFACNGGCPKDRFTSTPDGEPGLHYLCESYRSFFGHVDKQIIDMGSTNLGEHFATIGLG